MLELPVLFLALVVASALLAGSIWNATRYQRVDFIVRPPEDARGDGAAAAFFERVLPVLAGGGFAMVSSAGDTTVLERRFHPAWTLIVAVAVFPLGLIALFVQARESVTIVTARDALEAHGHCRKTMAAVIADAASELCVSGTI